MSNPYFEAWAAYDLRGFTSPFNQEAFDREMQAFRDRGHLVMEYAWAVPSDEALAKLVELSPIVEVGAGGGYWTSLLRERGADVLAYDLTPTGASTTESDPEPRRVWADVLEADQLVGGEHADRTLFLCWPPYSIDMARAALASYLSNGGQTLAYVGEDHGCTASDAFFELRDSEMEEVERIWIPTWPGMHDYLGVWKAK